MTTENGPKVSVVIPTHRRPELLQRALRSVIDQSFTDFEVLVVDDNSVGHEAQLETEKIVREFDDDRIRYIANESSQGGGEARNIGIRQAIGEFVAFLDDDEDWMPEKLERQIEKFNQVGADVGVIDTGFYDWKSDGKCRVARPKMQGWILERLLLKTGGRAPKLSTLLCRRSVVERAGLFDPALKARQDYDLYVRLSRLCQFDSVMEPLSNKRADATGRITSNPDNFVQGYGRVYEKVRAELEERPKTHAIFLLKYAHVLVAAGNRKKARELYFKALRLWLLNPRLISYAPRIFFNSGS